MSRGFVAFSLMLGSALAGVALAPLGPFLAGTVAIVLLLATAITATWPKIGHWLKMRGNTELDIQVEIGLYSVRPVSPGEATYIHRLLDVLIASREANRLDVRVKLLLQMPDGSEWFRPALIECPGGPMSYAEQPSLEHLPTEIALPPDGDPVRGHVEFATPNRVDPDVVFAVIEDIRSSRTKMVKVREAFSKEVADQFSQMWEQLDQNMPTDQSSS